MEFCELCGTMFILNTDNTKELMNVCLNCGNSHAVKGSTKIYEENFNISRNKEILLRYACDLITVPRSIEFCPTCKKDEVVAVISSGTTLKEQYICCKCRNYW